MSEIRIIHNVNSEMLSVSKKEILRYLRISKETEQADELIKECLDIVYKAASPRAVYIESEIQILDEKTVRLNFADFESCGLAKNLKECKKAYVFAATLGIELDRAIEKYSKIAQSKAAVCHAIGSALIESFCDYVNMELVGEQISTRRFSPGYSDLSLNVQPIVLKVLDAERKIGIILGDSLLMQPSKSVTAIIGIK